MARRSPIPGKKKENPYCECISKNCKCGKRIGWRSAEKRQWKIEDAFEYDLKHNPSSYYKIGHPIKTESSPNN